MTENQTRTVITVHPLPADVGQDTYLGETVRVVHRPAVTVRYDADNYATDARGELDVLTGNDAVARWAPGTWQRVEVTEEPEPIQDECSAPAGEFVPDEEMAEQIARAHYDAIDPYEDSRARGPESLANKLYAAALDGLRA